MRQQNQVSKLQKLIFKLFNRKQLSVEAQQLRSCHSRLSRFKQAMPVHHDVVRCVASYLQWDPACAMQCSPCPGPPSSRWRWRSKLFPYKTRPTCRCDGRGFCVYTVDDASPRLTLRCTCERDCIGAELELWAAACDVVVMVLKKSALV